MFLVVQERRVLTIIDTGSCNNLVSSDLIRKLGLETRPLHFPYNIEWFNNSGKAKVTHSARIHFSVGSYHDYVDFDVVCFY
jgi:predicted aspartyl protease